MPENKYTGLIAGYHFDKPRFRAWVYFLTEIFNEQRRNLAALSRAFDVDYAVGDQLDAVGVRVGIGRNVPETITGIFFAFDDKYGYGFDRGVWKGRYQSEAGITRLGDETYRAMIKAKIRQNKWDGTMGSLRGLARQLAVDFGADENAILVEDRQDMSVVIRIRKADMPQVLYELLTRRMIDFVAAGVGSTFEEYSPYFGLDKSNVSIQGLDQGDWSAT